MGAASAKFDHSALRDFGAAMFAGRGLPEADAQIAADGLIDGDLRGVPTHGLVQLPIYLSLLEKGVTNPRPAISIAGKSALLRVEADRAVGQVATVRTLEALKPGVSEHGLAAASISNSGHLGGLGYFVRLAAEEGLVALVMQNGPPLMGLPGSTARAIGNNPLAFGAPVPGGPPLIFDIATSEAAYGKILRAQAAGAAIPEGWALDVNGVPTTDPAVALKGILVSMAGAKGIGLAMMVEIFAGSLSGTIPVAGGNIFGGFVLLADPLAVQDSADFDAHMSQWIAAYRRSSPDARYPGERAAADRARQLQSGVVLEITLADMLAELGAKAGIVFPSAL